MYICPHCNKPGLPRWRRACLGPAIPATCTACGGKIGVPYGRTLVAGLPLFASVVVALLARNPTLSLCAVLVGAIATPVLLYRFVPLIKK